MIIKILVSAPKQKPTNAMRTLTYFLALAVMVVLSACGQTETAEASATAVQPTTAPASAPK